MLNAFKLSLQYILPKLWLTRLAGWGASKRAGWLTKLVIDLFVKYYKVDMKEAQKPDTASYRTFNEFFVRPLRDDVRPVNTDPNVSWGISKTTKSCRRRAITTVWKRCWRVTT